MAEAVNPNARMPEGLLSQQENPETRNILDPFEPKPRNPNSLNSQPQDLKPEGVLPPQEVKPTL